MSGRKNSFAPRFCRRTTTTPNGPGPNRLREILPDEADELLKRRFAIIQVWRAINRPIQSNPLALADARSVMFDDLMVAERRYPHRVGPDLSAQVQSAAPLDLFSRDAP